MDNWFGYWRWFSGSLFFDSLVQTVLYQQLRVRHLGSIFWLIYLPFVMGLVALNFAEFNNMDKAILFFWLILPLINAPLDWLSLGITRGLLQSLRSGQHTVWLGFAWALADVVLALVLLTLISAVLFFTILLSNYLGGEPVLDLFDLLTRIENIPNDPDLYWIYFMLFSTLLLTLLHFAIAGASTTLWFPEPLRHRLVNNWQNNANKKLGIWFYVSVMPVFGSDTEHLSIHASRAALFENWVVIELVKHCFNRIEQANLYFWRDNTGNEVDIIIDRGECLQAIEIKSGQTLSTEAFNGLKRWLEYAQDEACPPCLCYGGNDSYRRSGITVTAWRDINQWYEKH